MDLTTTYMGLALKNPLIVSSSPASANEERIQKAADAGAAAIVLPSLFEEQVSEAGKDFPYFPPAEDYLIQPEAYFDFLQQAACLHDIPIIGSLNGVTSGGWADYAKKIQDAGAQALELNLYHLGADPNVSSGEIEQRILRTIEDVKATVRIPVAVKLCPFFSSLGNMAQRMDQAGVDALVLFNRFYQPDFNLVAMEMEPSLSLSNPTEIRLPLRWIAMLHGTINASLAASTGVQSGVEVIKFLLAGADAVMSASALLQNGPEYIGVLLRDLKHWMETNEYDSVREFQGLMSQKAVPDPENHERANYLKVIGTYCKKYA